MAIDQAVQDVLHAIIDVVSGKVAHLPQDAADAFHELITPGHTAVPLTDAEKAQLAALEERKAREDAEKAKPAPAPAADAADEGAPGESVASNTAG